MSPFTRALLLGLPDRPARRAVYEAFPKKLTKARTMM
jgi:hypothetical protein